MKKIVSSSLVAVTLALFAAACTATPQGNETPVDTIPNGKGVIAPKLVISCDQRCANSYETCYFANNCGAKPSSSACLNCQITENACLTLCDGGSGGGGVIGGGGNGPCYLNGEYFDVCPIQP